MDAVHWNHFGGPTSKIRDWVGGRGSSLSPNFHWEGKHPIQFRFVPVLGHEPEADCNWQPLDSRLDLNIDETETWQRGLCSTFWLASCYTDPFYCQINSVSGLQYVRAVRWCHSALGPTWNSSQSKLMAIQKLHETLPINGEGGEEKNAISVSKSHSKGPLTCTPASMEALHVHGEWRLYSALLIKNSFTNTFAVLHGDLSVDLECLNKTTIFTFKYLGQTLQTKPSPAQSPSSHLLSRGERESANHRASDQKATDRSGKTLWKDIRSYTGWHRQVSYRRAHSRTRSKLQKHHSFRVQVQ